jgi:nucleotide-binding universal stress UspA family protein
MSYKILLALAAGQAHDQDCLTVCADLAKRFAAEGQVLSAAPDAAYATAAYDLYGMALLDPGLSAKFEEARREVGNLVKLGARKAAKAAGIGFGPAKPGEAALSIEPAAATPWQGLLSAAPFVDLVVIARAQAMGSGVLSEIFADALMELRLPILIANGARPAAGGTAVVAWNGGIEAGRAVRAALPLLRAADRVLVAHRRIGAELGTIDEEAARPERCADYLRRHGMGHVEMMTIGQHAGDEALIGAVKDAGADLMVAGAYGHPRWQESLFGGFTRTLFRDEDAPHVLVSH